MTSLAMVKRLGLGSSGSSSIWPLKLAWTGALATACCTAGWLGAAFTVEGATIWLTSASKRQPTQTAELIRMSRMAGSKRHQGPILA